MAVTVFGTATPNPNAMKFTLDRPVSPGASRTFSSAADAAADPLAAALFAIPGVKMVFTLNDFITVSKTDDASWSAMQPAIEDTIRKHYTAA